MAQRFIINRRSGDDRRSGQEQRENPRLDLPHKRRRKTADRRSGDARLARDMLASIPADSSGGQANKH